MRRFIAIDPSLRCTGWAAFEDGVLSGCGVVRTVPGTPVAAAASAVAGHLFPSHAEPWDAVIEQPQVYRGRRSKGDPNDLIAVAAVAGACIARAAGAELVTPHQWKGTIPKTRRLDDYIVHRRNLQELPAGSNGGEAYSVGLARTPAALRHNVADAVGLGIWAMRQNLLHIKGKEGRQTP